MERSEAVRGNWEMRYFGSGYLDEVDQNGISNLRLWACAERLYCLGIYRER